MKLSKKIVLVLLASVVALTVVGAYVLTAMNRVQPFYAQAIESNRDELKSAGRRMEQRVAELYQGEPDHGRWEARFSDEEVNGWLATYLKETRPELLPPEVVDPRIAFAGGRCKVGFRYLGERLSAVISVEAEASMAASDVAAVRLRSAYLGALPLPLSEVVEEINKIARTVDVPIRWSTEDGDPVLLVAVVDALSTDGELRQLQEVTLGDGTLSLAGSKAPRTAHAGAVIQPVIATAGQ